MPEQIILYDAEFFMSYEVSGIISNTNNGIIYQAVAKSDRRNVVIKQINKKMLKYFYQIHGQPCPAEFVYHFTASAGEGSDYMVKPIEWLEGNVRSKVCFVQFIFSNVRKVQVWTWFELTLIAYALAIVKKGSS